MLTNIRKTLPKLPATTAMLFAMCVPAVSMAQTPVQGTVLDGTLPSIPTPQVTVRDVKFIPTVVIDQTTMAGEAKVDVSMLDDFLNAVAPNARHYPPNFPNRSQRYNTIQHIKAYNEWITPFAQAPNASYDILLRAAKINGMARNLDMGSDYTVAASNYIAKALSLQPDSQEANLLYGIMLSEGGAYKQGKKYLDKAAAQGSIEAEQTMAQAEIMADDKAAGLDRLRRLQTQYPDNQQIAEQIAIVESGKYRIWDIAHNDLDIKALDE